MIIKILRSYFKLKASPKPGSNSDSKCNTIRFLDLIGDKNFGKPAIRRCNGSWRRIIDEAEKYW